MNDARGEDGEGKDSDVKVKGWRIEGEEEGRRYDSWQEGRRKRKEGHDNTMTLFILFLVPGWHHRQLPLHCTAASAITRPERDYLLICRG